MRTKIASASVCLALLWTDVAIAQAVNLQGCPATRGEAGALVGAQLDRKPNGTTVWAVAPGTRFMGDPVLGIFAADDWRWVHIQLPRAPSAYASTIKARYAGTAESVNCDDPDNYCYVRLRSPRYQTLSSFDFSKFEGRFEKEGEPDGRYLICFY